MPIIQPMWLPFRASTYAMNIYLYGTNRLTARDGFVGVPADYYTPVEQYAANNFKREQIDNAHDMTWINDTEYAETLALMPA